MNVTRSVSAVVVALALTACSTPREPEETGTAAGDYPWYTSPEELRDAADLIVEGRVTGVSTRPIDVSGSGDDLDYTVYEVWLLTPALKGEAWARETVEVKHPADARDPGLEEGAEYVLFLEHGDGDVPASLLNPGQSAYRVTDGGSLEPTDAENTLDVDRASLED